jgi:plastocyanin
MKLSRMLAVAVVLLTLAACGGDGDTTSPGATSPGATSPPAAGTTLVMKDNVFDPTTFTIATGNRITLKNEGANPHNFSVEGQELNEDFELPAGTYTMFCRFHRAGGMEGTLTVTG